MIFDVSMAVVGILVIAASWFVHRAFERRSITIPITVLGVGALGVGLFPGYTGNPHAVASMVTFVGGGVAAVGAAHVMDPPMRYLSAALGTASLTVLGSSFLGDLSPLTPLGIGGIERWIAYPVVVWLIATGAWLCGRASSGAVEGFPP